jgi:hypothetical protein
MPESPPTAGRGKARSEPTADPEPTARPEPKAKPEPTAAPGALASARGFGRGRR